MARRPSTASISPIPPSVSNEHASKSSLSIRSSLDVPSMSAKNLPLASQRRTSSSKLPNYDATMDPDQLFTKHSVSEVKYVQQKIRADADAKQEELRLMVGERYRDLLQASTSIISIAQSSRRIKASLVDAKDSVLSQEEPPLKKPVNINGNNDSQLQVLQQLSAHVKLLLDTPEHLWRLMETKKYYSAAWLFLLTRVVHQALVRDDEDDEEGWTAYGVDVAEQFPLIDRQWEVVSQFRSQISHKATLSLREYSMTPEDTCSALVTLHLLDSRPLMETLAVLLSQRTKTLNIMLSWPAEKPTPRSTAANGHAPDPKLGSRPNTPREVRQAIQSALEAICRTSATVQKIFDASSSDASLISKVMEHIQADQSTSSLCSLPPELQLTTQTLLQWLPSSTHFALLPPSIRSYKPYVDVSSASSSVSQDFVKQRLGDWFQKAISNLRNSAERWISDIGSVKEVWNIRSWIRRWILSSSKLEHNDGVHLLGVLDDIFKKRMATIWKLTFLEAGESFSERLQLAISSLQDSSIPLTDKSILNFLFQAPPLPASQTAGLKSITADSSLQKYKTAVRKRLSGRTAILDGVLDVLENCAAVLQKDLAHIFSSDVDDLSFLATNLEKQYHNDARTLCGSVTQSIDSTLNAVTDDDSSVDALVFLSLLLDELLSRSSFSISLAWDASMMSGFRQSMRSLHDQCTVRWRKQIIHEIFDRKAKQSIFRDVVSSSSPTGPSSSLIHSLFHLCNSIQRLGLYRDHDDTHKRAIVDETLKAFINQYLSTSRNTEEASTSQELWNLLLLRHLDEMGGESSPEVNRQVEELKSLASDKEEDIKQHVAEYLIRTQTLFAALLPVPRPMEMEKSNSVDKLASLLTHGLPSKAIHEEYKPGIELAKPSTRFGLLLVADTSLAT